MDTLKEIEMEMAKKIEQPTLIVKEQKSEELK